MSDGLLAERAATLVLEASTAVAAVIAPRPGRDRFNERDDLGPLMLTALGRAARSLPESGRPTVRREHPHGLPGGEFPRLGRIDAALTWPDGVAFVELKAGDDPGALLACAWDLVKLASCLAHATCQVGVLVAACPTDLWQGGGRGAELLRTGDWTAADIRDRYAGAFRAWERDGYRPLRVPTSVATRLIGAATFEVAGRPWTIACAVASLPSAEWFEWKPLTAQPPPPTSPGPDRRPRSPDRGSRGGPSEAEDSSRGLGLTMPTTDAIRQAMADAVGRCGTTVRRLPEREAGSGLHELCELAPTLRDALVSELPCTEIAVGRTVSSVGDWNRPTTRVDLTASSEGELLLVAELRVWDVDRQLLDLAKVCGLLAAGARQGFLVCVARAAEDFDRLPGGELFPARAGEPTVFEPVDLIARHTDEWCRQLGANHPGPTAVPSAVRMTAITDPVAVTAYPGHQLRAVEVTVIDPTSIDLYDGLP